PARMLTALRPFELERTHGDCSDASSTLSFLCHSAAAAVGPRLTVLVQRVPGISNSRLAALGIRFGSQRDNNVSVTKHEKATVFKTDVLAFELEQLGGACL